jgi:hypothetical protein
VCLFLKSALGARLLRRGGGVKVGIAVRSSPWETTSSPERIVLDVVAPGIEGGQGNDPPAGLQIPLVGLGFRLHVSPGVAPSLPGPTENKRLPHRAVASGLPGIADPGVEDHDLVSARRSSSAVSSAAISGNWRSRESSKTRRFLLMQSIGLSLSIWRRCSRSPRLADKAKLCGRTGRCQSPAGNAGSRPNVFDSRRLVSIMCD